jgi:arylsulfatase A-like enzyme
MKNTLNRRDFLKFASLLSLNLAAPQFLFRPGLAESGTAQNVLIVVFDAWSAANISLYGYARQTTPELSRLVEKGTVYHQHYANGPFTPPGTASLLTGTLPWTHRALDHSDGVADQVIDKSIFHAFDQHHCMAYSHNTLVNTILKQFLPAIDDYTPQGRLFLDSDAILYDLKDDDIAPLSWARIMKQGDDGISYSLLLSRLYDLLKKDYSEEYKSSFPRGLPNIFEDSYYILDHGINWIQNLLTTAPQPFVGYFHFLPPHFPYKTKVDFYDQFANDGYEPLEKPEHIFATKRASGRINEFRRWYDEYILYVDSEFARLYRFMEQNNLLDNTWLVLTSDHGELFERGIVGHQAPPIYQALARIPLVIFTPGQNSRVDIHERTNAIDVLPTLTQNISGSIPDWAEGDVLPPFASLNPNRPIVTLRGKGIGDGKPIHKGSAMLLRGNHKLIYVFGYVGDLEGGELTELYDLENDPEELNDLAPSRPDIVEKMVQELKVNLAKTA